MNKEIGPSVWYDTHRCQEDAMPNRQTFASPQKLSSVIPDWSNRRTDSLAGWINELATLADHHASMPGFVRSAMKTIAHGLAEHATQPGAASTAEVVANWVAEQWHAEVAARPLVNIHRKRLDEKWRRLLDRLHVDHRARLGPTHDELVAELGSKS